MSEPVVRFRRTERGGHGEVMKDSEALYGLPRLYGAGSARKIGMVRLVFSWYS